MTPEERPPEILLDQTQVGRLLTRERLWPSPTAWLVLVGVPALTGLTLTPATGAAGAVAAVTGMLLLLVAMTLGGVLENHRIHERAILLGVSWPRARPYVVPWATVDPARVRLHHRANLITRRMGNQGSRTLRMAPWSTVAVSMPGLAPDLASPRLRQRQFAVLTRHGIDAAAQLRAAQRDARTWNTTAYPTTTWVIGTRHPERLLTTIENALLAAGRPDARGLAARELADPVTERWRHPLHDDDIL